MRALPRTDTSLLGAWWWTVDRWQLAFILVLIGFGLVMILAASPSVARTIGLDQFHFAKRHLYMLAPALVVLLATSFLSPVGVRRVAVAVLIAALFLTLMTLFLSPEIKGSRRWLSIGGMSIQPTEFVKPALFVVAAWMFSLQRGTRRGLARFPGDAVALGLLALFVVLTALQPDFGMALTAASVMGAQYFMAGLPLIWAFGIGALFIGGLGAGYAFLPHVKNRIDSFLDPASGDHYQIDTSLAAFSEGGLMGKGPGEGTLKAVLPDAHADFIFAVVGEEFGLIACLLLVALFAVVVVRGLMALLGERDLFVMVAAGGLLTQFGLQAFINMAVTLSLIPTKGMTLPFISYGGSSLIALAFGMGMVLALTRRRPATARMP